ncbi:hypothetical protein O6H91_02G057900 [Diphasiastrum complanatum]|nr:hypothetical protein O6H91_Y513500 [Diphasiastrum complanatum]KAJ7565376.1 hypothetical protein O6H91_02G057900 [Diphasiastrum complanatum]
MWLGGWRPTSAIVLVFSIMGIESQKESVDAFEPHRSTPLLTERQLYSLKSLQAHTQQAEHDLSNQLGLLQMLVADQNVITAVCSRDWSKTRVAVEEKVSKLRDLLIQADSLRSQTLHELYSVLDPIQAAKCSIAAFELAFAINTFTGSLLRSSPSGSRAVEHDTSNGKGVYKSISEKEKISEKREVADHHSSSVEIEPLKHFSLEGSGGDEKGDCS